MNDKTRLKMSYLVMFLAFTGGILKVILKGFPLTEVFSLVGVAFGGYMTARTVSNMDEAKYQNCKEPK